MARNCNNIKDPAARKRCLAASKKGKGKGKVGDFVPIIINPNKDVQ
jgi:hypothetical protein